MYYLFSAHNWPLSELRALWEGGTAWHDLVNALASYEANQRAERAKAQPRKAAIKTTKRRK